LLPSFQKDEALMPVPSARVIPFLALTAALFIAPAVLQAQDVKPAETPRPKLDVIFVPTPQAAVEMMLDMAILTPQDFLIDLGAGDGRIAITAGKRGARALGVDLDPQRIAEAKANLEKAGVSDKVTFVQQNLFETDLTKATVITMYLLPSLNLKLRPTILKLKPGTRIVSHDFTMGEWKEDRFEVVEGRDLYFWRVPARVEGRWRVRAGKRRMTLHIRQKYQQIAGHVRIGLRSYPLRDAKLSGANISFTVDTREGRMSFAGAVDRRDMKGNVMRNGREMVWTAKRRS
jgi:SAM-dependent methyltransferase